MIKSSELVGSGLPHRDPGPPPSLISEYAPAHTVLVKVFIMVSAFTFCWSPYAILSVIGFTGYSQVEVLMDQGVRS